jgi:hypothetical protein
MYILKTSRDMQMLFANLLHINEGLSLEALLALKVEKSLIPLADTRIPTESKTD